jgi:hypothetical protein
MREGIRIHDERRRYRRDTAQNRTDHRPRAVGPRRQSEDGQWVGRQPQRGAADDGARVPPRDHLVEVVDVGLAALLQQLLPEGRHVLAKGLVVEFGNPRVLRIERLCRRRWHLHGFDGVGKVGRRGVGEGDRNCLERRGRPRLGIASAERWGWGRPCRLRQRHQSGGEGSGSGSAEQEGQRYSH